MTTQTHKWLPSEPTPAMLEAEQFASSLVYESHEVQAVEVYKAMWQVAPVAEQELFGYVRQSLDGSNCIDFYQSHHVGAITVWTHPQTDHNVNAELLGALKDIVEMVEMNGFGKACVMDAAKRAIEKAHGIGVE
jgi:hypothetical protein